MDQAGYNVASKVQERLLQFVARESFGKRSLSKKPTGCSFSKEAETKQSLQKSEYSFEKENRVIVLRETSRRGSIESRGSIEFKLIFDITSKVVKEENCERYLQSRNSSRRSSEGIQVFLV